MTALPGWMVARTHDLPADPRLRKAAEEARAAGKEWTCVVVTPSPALGRTRRARETLIIGHRAARVRLGVVQWGRWDSDHQVIHLDRGIAVDLAGRKATIPVDIAPIAPGTDPMPRQTPSRWLVGATVLVGLEFVVLLYAFPLYPTTTHGWVLLLALGPPAILGGEWLLSRARDPGISYADWIGLVLILLMLVLVPVMWWSLAHRG